MNRSRLPWMPRPPFAAKSESPITTTRVSGFGASSPGFGGVAGGGAATAADDRGAEDDRPLLVAFRLVERDLPGREQALDVGLRPAPRARFDERLRGVAVHAAGHRRRRARQRKGGEDVEALGDRVRRIVGHHRHRRVGADQAPHAAHVDDDVVADVDAPVVGERDQVRQRRAVRLVRRIELEQQLAGLVEILLERVDFRREEVVLRPGDDHHRGIVRHRPLLGDAPACRRCSSRGRARRRWRCSRRARPTSCPSRRGPA